MEPTSPIAADASPDTAPWVRRASLAIALTSGSLLFYEVAITRILSATLYYHGVFLALAMAMLGLAAPGVWFATRPPGEAALPRSLVAAGVAIPGSILVILHVGRLLAIREDDTVWGLPALTIVSLLVPTLALGAAICLLLMRAPGRAVGTVYGADLLGSTAGALAVIPAMRLLPTPSLLALTGVLPLAAAAIVDARSRRVAAALAAVIVATVAWAAPYKLRYNRVYVEHRDPLFERWTPTARITVEPAHPRGAPIRVYGWGWGAAHQHVRREQLWVRQEGGAGTPMMRLDAWPSDVSFLLDDVTSAGAQVAEPRRACVIGAGAGRDVLATLAAGASDVDAVELNEAIYEAVSSRFGRFSHDPYHLPGVHGVVSEGRNFLTRSRGGYDAITISLVDSWAATAAGAYALSENHLYTVEALRLYWSRLSPRGVASVSRWFAPERQHEMVRLTLMAVEALRQEGVSQPRAHLAVLGGSRVGNLLLSRVPFTEARLARLREVSARRGFMIHWPPVEGGARSAVTLGLTVDTPPTRFAGRDISPAVDDQPFFFQSAPLLAAPGSAEDFNDHAMGMLRTTLALTTALVAALLAAPFLRRRGALAGATAAGSVYFAAIGLAFMFVELSVIQRFVLYLGHPSYATTVVLASLLAGAGLGASFAGRLSPQRLAAAVPLVPLAAAALTLATGALIDRTLGASFAARVALAVVTLAPAGAFLGLAFPAGMTAFGDRARAWHWAVNGGASVLGSVSSLALAMAFGFANVAWLGVVAYLVATLALRRATTP